MKHFCLLFDSNYDYVQTIIGGWSGDTVSLYGNKSIIVVFSISIAPDMIEVIKQEYTNDYMLQCKVNQTLK